ANGDELVEVVVDDDKGGRITVPVRIVVTPVNDKPVVGAIPHATPEDTALNTALAESASDVDGDTIRFVLFTPPKNGRATLSKTGELRYTPPRDWHGKDVFTVEVDDGQAFARADFTIAVEPVNDAPVTQPLSLTSDEDRTAKGTLRASDVDGDKLRWSVRDQPQHGEAAVDADSGRVTFTPAKDWHGKDAFVVVANDGTTETPAAVDVVVAAVPDPPNVFAATLPVTEDTTAEGALPAREPDGERLTFVLVGEPKLGAVTLLDKNSGRVRYVPRADVNGTDRIGFTATDNITVVNGVFDVVIAAVNDAPTAVGATATTTEDVPVEVTIAMRDVDDDALGVTVVGAVDGGRVEIVDAKQGRLRVHPDVDKHGSVKFQVAATETATKPPLSSKPVPVEVKVDPRNDPPVLVAARFSTPEDTQLKGALKSSDVDGDVLAFRVGRAAGRGAVEVDKKSGAFVYTPQENMFGPDSFTIVARDPAGLEATGVVSVDVVAVDDPPIALDGRLRSPRAGRVTGQLIGRDPEGAPLRFVIMSKPSIGRVQLLDEKTGAYAYYAEGGQRSGPTSFTFVIEAGNERSLPASVQIEVQ
ncbi:MAG TPA: Ig-like domain-containing protein, partial [Myxococcota bacterium]